MKLVLKKSEIAGRGVFPFELIPTNEVIGLAFTKVSDTGKPDNDYIRTKLGEYVNHSAAPNLKLVERGKNYFFQSMSKIEPGEELVIDYQTFPWTGERGFVRADRIRILTQMVKQAKGEN